MRNENAEFKNMKPDMNTKRIAAALFATLLLAVLPLTACNGDNAADGNEPIESAAAAEATYLVVPETSAVEITEASTDPPRQTSNVEDITRRDFVDALSDGDIESAKKTAEQFYKDMPNNNLGVISITFDSELRKGFAWDERGAGLVSLGDSSDTQKFLPGNLVVFNVETKRYGDVDQITLGRKDINSEWEIISYGR